MSIKQHIRMTASEIAMGRYMRAPDHAAAATAADAEFDAAFSEETLKDVAAEKGAIGGGDGAGATGGADAGADGAGAASGDAAGAAVPAAGDAAAGADAGAAAGADAAAGAAGDGKAPEGAAPEAGSDAGDAAGGDAGAAAGAVDGGAAGKDGAGAAAVPAGPDADEILRRLAAEVAKQPKAEVTAAAETPAAETPPMFTAEETAALAKFKEDWPSEYAAVELMQRELGGGIVQYVFDQIAPAVREIKELTHALATRAAHGDIVEELGEYPSDDEIDKVKSWVETQPSYLQAPMNGVIESGTADEIIDLVGRYREATGTKPAGAQVEEPKPQGGETELSEQAKKAAVALAPVGSQRTAVQSPEDASDFDAGWARWADQPV